MVRRWCRWSIRRQGWKAGLNRVRKREGDLYDEV